MVRSKVVIPKVWRSELKGLGLFFAACVTSVLISRKFPGSIIEGTILPLGSNSLHLALPLWWFVPLGVLLLVAHRIYNVRFTVDSRGVEARIGVLSFYQRVMRVRYEDIRSIEIEQTVLERLLDVGNVEISTASTEGVEVMLTGVAAPWEVQEMLHREREAREKSAKENHYATTANE